MFFSEHRLKMTSLRIGKHRIVKNIASLRKVNIAHPYPGAPEHCASPASPSTVHDLVIALIPSEQCVDLVFE